MDIRPYVPQDFATINEWCKAANVVTLTEDTLPWSTFIHDYKGQAAVSLSLILSNAKEYAYLEYAIGNPEIKKDIRRELFSNLVKYIERVAKQMGYKKLVCLAPHPKLEAYYSTLGYQPNLKGLTAMIKELN